jgi:GDPmannose 4,6-dehydratase
LLLEKEYEVYGLVRRSTTMDNRKWIDHLDVKLLYGDMLDGTSLEQIIQKIKPDEVYNLASQSHVGISFKIPEYTADVNGLGVIRLLEAIRKTVPMCRVYQASTSEMYGSYMQEATEESPFSVNSPYAASKLFAHNICEMYREAYDMFICCGILFNHESPRRGLNFVTRKITNALCQIAIGDQDELVLGNLEAERDWGFAGDYVEAMWLMLQQDVPDDFVIATGKTHSVREFVEAVCKRLRLHITWHGKGLDEFGMIEDKCSGIPHLGTVSVSKKYYRPKDVHFLKGNPKRALEVLGWKPKTNFKELVELMVHDDLRFPI